MENGNLVKSVDRALRIINIVSMKKEGCGVTELAKELNINKSSVFRILGTLSKHGFIEQIAETSKYKLGYKHLELSSRLLESIDLRKEAKHFLEELEQHTNEVVHLVVFDGEEAVYIEKLEGNETLRMHSQVGKRAPIHCSSVGKMILSQLSQKQVLKIIEAKGLPKHTERTITHLDDLLEELRQIKEQGFALDLEENEPGMTCIAGPIWNHLGEIVGSVSVSGPTIRMTDDRLNELKPIIKSTCEKISERLGWSRI